MAQPEPLKIKIQMFCGDEIALGPGKADLLDAISCHGSISAAARAMGMSYRRAWLLVDAMNRCWREPLVHTTPGRAANGGARLTDAGRRVLEAYRALQISLESAAQNVRFSELRTGLRPAPIVRKAGAA
jgi:molybdate transport system regulatory protein